MFFQKNYAAGGENGSIMVGMFVFLCLASQKPSEREFFVPARTDLGVKLLSLNGSVMITITISITSPCASQLGWEKRMDA